MKPMRTVAALLVLALLAGCASGPPKRVFPPQATVQELRLQPDGRVVASVRMQNFSTVPMTFSRLQATLTLAGHEATRIDIDPGLTVGPGSNELVSHPFVPSPAAQAALDDAFAAGRTVRYRLSGRIASSEPAREDEFDWSSALDPVPGLPGVMR